MKCFPVTACLLLLMGFPLATFLWGQYGAAQNDQAAGNPPTTMSTHHQLLVTGCLKKGGGPRDFYITDQNGKTWKLTSDSVNLAEHVNHSVTITGKEAAMPKQQEGKEQESEKNESGGKSSAGLRVLTLKMLSPSCTR